MIGALEVILPFLPDEKCIERNAIANGGSPSQFHLAAHKAWIAIAFVREVGNGVECRGRNTQSRQRVFYPVFTSGDDDGTTAALSPVPELPTERNSGPVMPDSEVKNRDLGRARA
jgi:hypothetical protein